MQYRSLNKLKKRRENSFQRNRYEDNVMWCDEMFIGIMKLYDMAEWMKCLKMSFWTLTAKGKFNIALEISFMFMLNPQWIDFSSIFKRLCSTFPLHQFWSTFVGFFSIFHHHYRCCKYFLRCFPHFTRHSWIHLIKDYFELFFLLTFHFLGYRNALNGLPFLLGVKDDQRKFWCNLVSQ